MKLKIWTIIFLVTLVAVACDQIDDACDEEKYGSALVSDFPDSLQAGVTHELKVKYIIENSCGKFVEFETIETPAQTEIKVKLMYEGCSCNLQFTEDSSYLSIKHDTAGLYLYKFYLSDGTYDTYQLNVFE